MIDISFIMNYYINMEEGDEHMIKIRLSRMMGDRRKNIQTVANETGLSRSTISQLYHEKVTRVDLETLDKLCDCLDCDIVDMLERVKE